MKQIVYVLIGLLVGFILAGALFLVTRLPDGKPIALEPSPTRVSIEVQVLGGVVHPGVYSFPEGSRVQDAIAAAGGLQADIDPNSINLVAKLQDGQQLNIPGGTSEANGTNSSAPFTVIPTPGGSSSTTSLININTATLSELESLPCIGPTTAQKIIDYRVAHVSFTSITSITNVQGIGPSTFDCIQGLITVH